jgi:hypothetical protein
MLPHLHTIQLNDEVVVGEYWPKKIYIWNLEGGERVMNYNDYSFFFFRFPEQVY